MTRKDFLKRFLIWLIIGIVSALLAHYLIEVLHHNYNYENVNNFLFTNHIELYLLGAGILLIIYILLSSIFGSAMIGSMLLFLLSWGLGLATRYKHLIRSEPLYPNELYMIKELPFLFEMIDQETSIRIIAVLLIAIFLTVTIYVKWIRPKNKKKNTKIDYLLRAVGIVFSGLLLMYVVRFNHPNNKINNIYSSHASWTYHNQTINYYGNGFIAGFLSNLKAPPMNSPEQYSKEIIEELYNKYEDERKSINSNREVTDVYTNVIFVMNESFSDPFHLEGIDANKDPLPNYRELQDEVISGMKKASSIGGGTATSEFQVLTGFSMEPFESHITSPYIQLVSQIEDFHTIVDKAKQEGLRATAIHPYTPTFYRRNDVYSNMNFDEFRHQDNMTNREKISDRHRYISDYAAYQEVFDVIRASPERDFVHLVTMQNHMTYADKYDYVDFEVTGSGNPEEANAYFKDLQNSDISLRLLINKINEYSEPILLVFWGDHLPGFYEGEVLEKNNRLKMLEAPFFIYSNEVNTEEQIELISPIYFQNYVSKLLNTHISLYDTILLNLEKNLPVIDNGMYYDRNIEELVDSRNGLSQEALEVLEDYSLLMYDMTTGNQYARELGFFDNN